eukprot:scaffold286_cov247-Pinguiococcus_pyrenoidosus.AAC.13
MAKTKKGERSLSADGWGFEMCQAQEEMFLFVATASFRASKLGHLCGGKAPQARLTERWDRGEPLSHEIHQGVHQADVGASDRLSSPLPLEKSCAPLSRCCDAPFSIFLTLRESGEARGDVIPENRIDPPSRLGVAKSRCGAARPVRSRTVCGKGIRRKT